MCRNSSLDRELFYCFSRRFSISFSREIPRKLFTSTRVQFFDHRQTQKKLFSAKIRSINNHQARGDVLLLFHCAELIREEAKKKAKTSDKLMIDAERLSAGPRKRETCSPLIIHSRAARCAQNRFSRVKSAELSGFRRRMKFLRVNYLSKPTKRLRKISLRLLFGPRSGIIAGDD